MNWIERPIAIGGYPDPFPLGRLVCECSWIYVVQEGDTTETLQSMIDQHTHLETDEQ